MKMLFLCSNHQAWLEDNPELARITSLQCSDRAQELWEEVESIHAVKFAGSGFEAAQIVLRNHTGPVSDRVELYTSSSVLLANILYSTKQEAMARSVLATAIADLESLLVLGECRREVLRGCQSLLSLGEEASGVPGLSGWEQLNTNSAFPSLLH